MWHIEYVNPNGEIKVLDGTFSSWGDAYRELQFWTDGTNEHLFAIVQDE